MRASCSLWIQNYNNTTASFFGSTAFLLHHGVYNLETRFWEKGSPLPNNTMGGTHHELPGKKPPYETGKKKVKKQSFRAGRPIFWVSYGLHFFGTKMQPEGTFWRVRGLPYPGFAAA